LASRLHVQCGGQACAAVLFAHSISANATCSGSEAREPTTGDDATTDHLALVRNAFGDLMHAWNDRRGAKANGTVVSVQIGLFGAHGDGNVIALPAAVVRPGDVQLDCSAVGVARARKVIRRRRARRRRRLCGESGDGHGHHHHHHHEQAAHRERAAVAVVLLKEQLDV